jgi:hypothetical protein
LIAAADVTESRRRLTASIHKEFVIIQCTIDSDDSEEALDPIESTLRDQGNESSACCDWIVQTASKLLFPVGDDDNDGAAPFWTAVLYVRHLAAVTTTPTILNASSSLSSRVDEASQPCRKRVECTGDFDHVLQQCSHECRTENNNSTFSIWSSLYIAADVFINTYRERVFQHLHQQ